MDARKLWKLVYLFGLDVLKLSDEDKEWLIKNCEDLK